MAAQFGNYVRELRLSKDIGLRQFCIAAEVDPSNWSKVERGIIAPPTDEDTLERISKVLGIEKGSPEWHQLSDRAFADRGIIPSDVMEDEELVAALPIFFRTARGQKPDPDELQQLVELLRRG